VLREKTKEDPKVPGGRNSAEMQDQINKPIFVVGSPRSGTSVLAWCLGQHPNIFPVPESNWMADFAVNTEICYQIGAARDNRSILSGMDISREEFFASFGQKINDLIIDHREDLQRRRREDPSMVDFRPFISSASASEPKMRWVDGTPEYSLHVYALRQLFPQSAFIHVLRNVRDVVRSMLNFDRVAGFQLVANEEEAYKYWLRTVSACVKAEQAYGPHVVHRLPYAALIENPESAMRALLDFLGEPYSAKCLGPLALRINSSNVPADFKSDDPATDPAIVEQARRLSTELDETEQPSQASRAAADEMEAGFRERYLQAAKREQQLLDQIARQERHYTAEIEQYKSEIARQEQHYTNLLRKQLSSTKRLSHLLEDVENAARRLRASRRWKLANPGATLKAKLSHGKGSTGYGHLEKIVNAYSKWRTEHPEIASIQDEINELQSPTIPKGTITGPKNNE
jgi:hypothetical protein